VIAYLLRRIAQALVVFVGVTIIVFAMIHLLPGNEAQALLGPNASQLAIRQFDIQNGLDRPVWIQYVMYLDQVLHGNLGYSYHYNETVSALLVQNLPKSALLVGLSTALALLVAVPVGMLQALRRNGPLDTVFTVSSFVSFSMPAFWLGFVLIVVFTMDLHLLPPEGPQGATVGAVLGDPRALILPVLTLMLVSVSIYARFIRSSASDNLVLDYVRTARAKGVSEIGIIYRHVLRNSLMPVISLLGLSLPYMIAGALVVEQVFNYPGMGLLFWNAATVRDYPVMLGFTLVFAAAAVLGTLLADILYAVADPRVRHQ
jgi:peptide/nickel transport system permease protein